MAVPIRSTTIAAREVPAFRQYRGLSAVLAAIGGIVSVYLAVYQYGGLTHIWEPFFGDGSALVLNSGILDSLSRGLGLPVHDAALGAVGYGLEAGLALAGKRSRSSSITWLDFAYCGLALLMGLTSLVLVLLQAAVFQAWCTLCLTSAVISEVIVLLSFHELPGVFTFLVQQWKGRQP